MLSPTKDDCACDYIMKLVFTDLSRTDKLPTFDSSENSWCLVNLVYQRIRRQDVMRLFTAYLYFFGSDDA